MSKKLFIFILSLALVLIFVGLIGYYFLIQNNNGTTNGTTIGFRSFFPFGGTDNPVRTATTTKNEPTVPPPTDYTKKLRLLSIEPVAGAGVLDIKSATSTGVGTLVRYIEKATGHIFEVELFSPDQNRISNTTIPLVYNALWGSKNAYLVAQYLKDDDQTIDTYSLAIKSGAATTSDANS